MIRASHFYYRKGVNAMVRACAPYVLLAAIVTSGGVAQQVTKVGTTSAKFLSIPVGARALGMGGAFVGVADDASAMYWNPSGIALLQRNQAHFSHTSWIADLNFNFAGVVVPLGEVGTVGINFTSLTMEEMERTTESQPEGTGQFFSAGSFATGVSYARNLAEWFSIGTNIKYIHEYIWNSSATGFAVDIGTLLSTPFTGLKFGTSVSNFGTKMRITGDDLLVQKDISPNNGNNTSVNANLSTDQFDLPLVLKIGFSYEPIVSEDQHLVLVVDAAHPNDNSESVSIGGEWSVFSRMLSIRSGYKGIGLRDGEEQFTLGGGLKYTFGLDLTARIDYAFEKFGRFDNVHKFSLDILF